MPSSAKIRQLLPSAITVLIAAAVILAAAGLSLAEFNYSNYRQASIEDIGAMVKGVAKEHEGSEGFDFFYDAYAIRVKLPAYPEPNDKRTSGTLDLFWKVTNAIKPEFKGLFTHQVELKEDGLTFVLVFQEKLVPYIREEMRPGEQMDVYAVLIALDEAKMRAVLLVNEFFACCRKEDAGGTGRG